MARDTVVDKVTEKIAFHIASGVYPPGTKLPSVRNLARDYDINPSTVQVVLAHLQSAGFVEAHQGVGFLVRDIELYGGIETWRYVFRFSQQLPDLAVAMLEDVSATRRALITDAARAIAADPGRYDPTPVRRAVDQLELLIGSEPQDLGHIAQAEVHAVRTILSVVRHRVALAVFNSVGEMVIGVPEVVRATWQDVNLEMKVVAWRALLGAWTDGQITEASVVSLDNALKGWDASVAQRFRALITRPATPARKKAAAKRR